MKGLLLQSEEVETRAGVEETGYGVVLRQGRDQLLIGWDDAIKLRDWLQLAIAERSEAEQQRRSGDA